jgi:hypothetical protein
LPRVASRSLIRVAQTMCLALLSFAFVWWLARNAVSVGLLVYLDRHRSQRPLTDDQCTNRQPRQTTQASGLLTRQYTTSKQQPETSESTACSPTLSPSTGVAEYDARAKDCSELRDARTGLLGRRFQSYLMPDSRMQDTDRCCLRHSQTILG